MKYITKFITFIIIMSTIFLSAVDVHAKQETTYSGITETETFYVNFPSESEANNTLDSSITPLGMINSNNLMITKSCTPLYNSITHQLAYIKVSITWEWLIIPSNYLTDTLVLSWDNTNVDWRMKEGSFSSKLYIKLLPSDPFVYHSTNYSMSDVYNNGFKYDQALVHYSPVFYYNKGIATFTLLPISNPNVQYKTLIFYARYFHKFSTVAFNGSVRVDNILTSGIPTIGFNWGFMTDFDSLALPFNYAYSVYDPNY